MKIDLTKDVSRPRILATACAAVFAAMFGVISLTSTPTQAEQHNGRSADEGVTFLTFATLIEARNRAEIDDAISEVRAKWSPALIPQLLETVRFTRSYHARDEVFALLREKTGQDFGTDFSDWSRWTWQQPELITDDYAQFKATLYSVIDPRFGTYFAGRQESARIRLDEIVWGGVLQDGIPPLRNPEMLSAGEADYLGDDNIVFGIVVNGEAHAYPKRVLAWHEMFVNEIGGVEITGVYCTLCGTVIPYRSHLDGKHYELGTSGFLYRSNKLMYDRATQSLWNTFQGTPVVGPLVDQGIELEREAVVTTTWGQWRALHPETKVLSLNTGHRRDYGEGVAYQDYFATDELMFGTPFSDERLANKQEVVALRFTGGELAIDTDFLERNTLYKDSVGLQDFLVVTDSAGSSRVYEDGEVTFASYDGAQTLSDSEGVTWRLAEDKLTAADGRELARLPSHRAFWFGWYASYPSTRLVK